MSKQKSIAEQIEEMQEANKMLLDYEKLFDKACQINFNCSAKSIKKMLINSEEPCSNFETKMRSFFGLKTEADMAEFIAIMCTESNQGHLEERKRLSSQSCNSCN